MNRLPSIFCLAPLLMCTLCASFPVILNLGGSPSEGEPVHSVHQAGPLSVVNWDDPPPGPRDPEYVWNETWALEEINDTPLMPQDISGDWPVLQFNEARSKIRGQSFCNYFSASCSLYGNRFSIGNIDKGGSHCAAEASFYKALARATHYFFDYGTLHLMDEDHEVLQFKEVKTMARAASHPVANKPVTKRH